MVVREIRAYIVCPKCGKGFEYTAMSVRTTLQGAYEFYIKYHLNRCVGCRKADLIVRDMSCKILQIRKKVAYDIRWQCNLCKGIWVQTEHLDGKELLTANLIDKFKHTVSCPNVVCASNHKTFLSISRSYLE